MASKNLLELRTELEEQTKEIQNLQKEVERATQNTINQLSFSYREQCYKPSSTNYQNATKDPSTSSSNSKVYSSIPLQALIFQSSTGTGQEGDPKKTSLPINSDLMKNIFNEPSHHVDAYSKKTAMKHCSLFRDTQRKFEQLNHVQGQHETHTRQPTSGIHMRIQELMDKKEMNMRPKCSTSKGLGNKEDIKAQELETTNMIQEEMLKQARVYTELLKEKLQKQDQILQDTQKAILVYNERSNRNVEDNLDLSNLGIYVVQTFQELSDEVSFLKEKIQSAEDHLNSLKVELKDKDACLKQCQESYDNLVNEHEQERAMLLSEMNTVSSNAKSIQTELEFSRDQSAKHQEYIATLESKMSQLQCDLQNTKKMYKDKVEELKKQLLSANGKVEDMRNEHAQCKQQYSSHLLQLNEVLKTYEKQLTVEKEHNKKLQDQEMLNGVTTKNLQRELDERRNEVERLQKLMNMVKEEGLKKSEQQLESLKDTLQKTSHELAVKTQFLEYSEKSLTETRNLLAEKDKSLQSVVDELKKLRMYAESKKRQVQQMKADNEKMADLQRDAETLKLLLVEKDNMIVTLRGQIEAFTDMTDQQNQKVDVLEMENSQLLHEVAVKNSEIQDLTIRADEKEKRIAELEELCTALELEKSKLVHCSNKKILAAKKMKKEREELMAKLRETQNDLANLAEGYRTLKRQYENQTGDKENTATILKMQLKAAVSELEQAKTTLNTVEDCDGHAVKIATRMQKKITAKREQLDMLQSRVHFLEESLSNAQKDKYVLKVEKKKLIQECVHESSERQRLSETVEILKMENNTLKGNVTRAEAALEKTLFQLSECQAVIQRLEQETVRLRLQHTLELQELKGPVSDLPGRSVLLGTATSLVNFTGLSQPQNKKQIHMCDATQLSKDSVEKPLEDVIDHPERLLPFKDESALKLRENTKCTSDHISKLPIVLHTADLENKEGTEPVKPFHVSSFKKHTHEQDFRPRSPVHSLLTEPTCDYDNNEKFYGTINVHELVDGETVSGFISDTYQNLHHRLECLQTIAHDLQMKNKEISSIFETADENICM